MLDRRYAPRPIDPASVRMLCAMEALSPRWTRKFDGKVTLRTGKQVSMGENAVLPSQFMHRLPTRVYRHFKVRCAHAPEK
jgi:hypothetical protein